MIVAKIDFDDVVVHAVARIAGKAIVRAVVHG